jgi:hypothetical protein
MVFPTTGTGARLPEGLFADPSLVDIDEGFSGEASFFLEFKGNSPSPKLHSNKTEFNASYSVHLKKATPAPSYQTSSLLHHGG